MVDQFLVNFWRSTRNQRLIVYPITIFGHPKRINGLDRGYGAHKSPEIKINGSAIFLQISGDEIRNRSTDDIEPWAIFGLLNTSNSLDHCLGRLGPRIKKNKKVIKKIKKKR